MKNNCNINSFIQDTMDVQKCHWVRSYRSDLLIAEKIIFQTQFCQWFLHSYESITVEGLLAVSFWYSATEWEKYGSAP